MAGAGPDRGRSELRAFAATDAPAVRALTAPAIEQLPWSEGARSAVDALVTERDADSRGLVATEGGHVVGLIIYGAVAGAVDTGRIQLVIVAPGARRRGTGARLVEGAIAALDAARIRLIFVELADDPALVAGMRLLLTCGFHVDARVPDYVRDGIDLVILRRDIRQAEAPREQQ